MTRTLAFHRLRDTKGEILGTVQDFVDRLEELTAESTRVSVLDLAGLALHLASAPIFLSARCAPRAGYRHVSNIGGEEDFQDLVRLIRRSAEAEKGAYFCAYEEPLLKGATSFCVVERDDGLHVFLVHEIGDEKPTSIVLFHDAELGRRLLGELDRLEAMILSMTPEERAKPDVIRGSRRRRIAAGSGTNVQAVKQLTKQFDQMRKMMKQLSSGKMPNPESMIRGQLGARRR